MLIILHSLCNLSIEILSDILYLQQIRKISFNSGGGGARKFLKINPYFLQCLAFFAFGAKASGYKKEVRTVANVWSICPRHRGFGLAKTRVASGQRGPRFYL